MKPSADKHFRCTICQRGFTRIDHLKRHHLRHSGLKPYSCVFCNESFARCDNLREHYNHCLKRGDQSIPETGQRGRRRHACESCTAMKLRCDGLNPCSSCQKRNIPCNNDRRDSLKDYGLPGGSASTDDAYEQSSDRGSIKFLLNAGTDSFTEQFLLPPRGDRARGLEYNNQMGLRDVGPSGMPYAVEENITNNAPPYVESDPASMTFFQDTFVSFFNGPFGDPHKPLEDPYSGGIPYQAVIPPGQDPNLTMPGGQIPYEQPFANALIQSILSRAWALPLDPKSQQEVSTNLNYLLTTARIRKFISLYFRYWHTSCPMIYAPSFDPETVTLQLLASLVFMGAMYSNDEMEVYVAKRVLDFMELFVFSCDLFACESEITANFCGNGGPGDPSTDWAQFQNFQAGFLAVLVQYWAGSRASKNRAMETRFSEIIKVARRMGLPKSRHKPQDRMCEYSWVQAETKIRTMSIISLLDCAFSFYQNHPCRLSHTEMECEFPCDESIFSSPHPFSEPNFRFTREVTISEAFQSLFEEYPKQDTSSSEPNTPVTSYERIRAGLRVFDMFIIIHILYAFINTHMTLLIPFIQRERASQAPLPAKSPGSKKPNKSMIPEDSILAAIRTALSRWRDHWVTLRHQVPTDEWASMGFYKNGYNFWLVSHLLITKKESVDVVMRMEVNCEDKLEKLKVLLMDDDND